MMKRASTKAASKTAASIKAAATKAAATKAAATKAAATKAASKKVVANKPVAADCTQVTTVVAMRLYIAGSAPNSVQAIANLEAICREHLAGVHRLEIVDILEHPSRALAEGVLVTPSLTKLSPLPAAQIVGNLSDKRKVLLALGIAGGVQ
jgi:circadian clock protein KaiB